jgi:hypothetical protein
MLLTLRHIPFDCSAKMPKARSHSGYGWEGVLPDPVHPICDGTSCTIDVDDVVTGVGGGYRVDAHVRAADETPTEAESAARLLLQGTFGVSDQHPSTWRTNIHRDGAQIASHTHQHTRGCPEHSLWCIGKPCTSCSQGRCSTALLEALHFLFQRSLLNGTFGILLNHP